MDYADVEIKLFTDEHRDCVRVVKDFETQRVGLELVGRTRTKRPDANVYDYEVMAMGFKLRKSDALALAETLTRFAETATDG